MGELPDMGAGRIDDGDGCANPYPFCQCFPWLPRGWWLAAPAGELDLLAMMSPEEELKILRRQEAELHARLKQIRSQISSLYGMEIIRQGGKTQ
jgi:hypothetical protein